MDEQDMAFHVGDQVIHWVYGPGKITDLDEKVLAGHTGQYYVVQMHDLTLWVPLNEAGEDCLRLLTPASDFQKLFALLSSPAEALSDDRYMRRTQLTELLEDRTLESICRVVRDLMHYKRNNRTNDHDNSILKRARNFLLNEWSLALSVPLHQADVELTDLLAASMV